MMKGCRMQRKLKGIRTIRELSKELGATENYVSAVENGREFPSLRLFLHYLLLNGFDTNPLKTLEITTPLETRPALNQKRSKLINQIYKAGPAQLEFLEAQAKLAEGYGIRRVRRKPSRRGR